MRKRKKKFRRRRVKILTRASRKRKRKTKPKKRAGRKMGAGKTGAKSAASKRKVAKGVMRKRTGKSLIRRPGAKKLIKRRRKKLLRRRRTLILKKPGKKTTHKIPAQKPVYTLDTDFEFFYELRDLILKSSPAEKDKIVERLNKIGRVKLAIISGVFINKENLDPLITDLFIVGDDIDRRKLRTFLKAIQAEVGKEIKFTVMDKEEFQYRLAMFDRFVRVLLEGPHEKLINRLGI